MLNHSSLCPFFYTLSELVENKTWTVFKKGKILRLKRTSSDFVYCPMSAVYFHLTGVEVGNCYWNTELTQLLKLDWWEVIDLTYAIDGCDMVEIGRRYDRLLRNRVLVTLGLPVEPVPARFWS